MIILEEKKLTEKKGYMFISQKLMSVIYKYTKQWFSFCTYILTNLFKNNLLRFRPLETFSRKKLILQHLYYLL